MEAHGVTASRRELVGLKSEYMLEADRAAQEMVKVAAEVGVKDFEPPSGGNSNALRELVFDVLRLPPIKHSEKTGQPSLDKTTLEYWDLHLPDGSPGKRFVDALLEKRGRDTAISYLEGYERFWQPWRAPGPPRPATGWFVLHPNMNPTGTDHLRWSHNNPNSANISKKEKFNLRKCFGPAPGREWWSLDYQNIELRIPAFEAQEEELMEIFLNPDRPPYFGSYHLVVFDTLHPQLFAQHGKDCKSLFESTWYQWVKNGNFAILYGCQEAKADATFRVRGGYQKIRGRFRRIAELNDRMIAYADKMGYVETIPDCDVDPDRGHPILTQRTENGRVMPTLPLNYHTSGTAMQCTNRAMIRCDNCLGTWRREGFDGWMVLQVHDELVFDFPRGTGVEPWQTNYWRAKELARLMALSGAAINVPTPVSIEWHSASWSVGYTPKDEPRKTKGPAGWQANKRKETHGSVHLVGG